MATTEGVKHDEDKPKFSLMKPDALMEMVAVLTYGAKKYSPDNWKHLENARQRYFDAANRHLWQWYGGEERDPESGLHHLAHAMSSLMFPDADGHRCGGILALCSNSESTRLG
jgi:hypothetical protein